MGHGSRFVMLERKDPPATSTPRNVLMFIDGLGSGGAQKQFAILACGLAAGGHTVTISVYNDQDYFADHVRACGIEIIKLVKSSRWSIKPVVGLARLYRRCRAEVVIAFLRTPAITAELARLIEPNMRIIAAERADYPKGSLPLTLRAWQHLHRAAAFVTVNSVHQRIRMQEEFDFLVDRAVTIKNAIAVPERPVTIRPSVAKVVRIVALASLMHYKNSVLLAEAVALLRDEFGIGAEISWMGETFEHLGDYGAYRETCAAIAAHGLEEKWAWLGTTQDVDRVLRDHDVLIHPSSTEGMSNAICEAMAIGLPVIAGRISDHQTLIEAPGAGLLFESYDALSIAETIARFANLDETSRSAMGQAGRTVIERDFSRGRMVSQYELVIEAAIKGCRKAPGELVDGSEVKTSCAA